MTVYKPQLSDVQLISARLPLMEEIENAEFMPECARYFWLDTPYKIGDKPGQMVASTGPNSAVFSFSDPIMFQAVRPVIEFDGDIEPGDMFMFGSCACTVISPGLAITNKEIGIKQYNTIRKVSKRIGTVTAMLFIDSWFRDNLEACYG